MSARPETSSPCYVVDGDNLIGSWGGPRAGDDRRAEVVRRVSSFCERRGAQAIVVFDGLLRPPADVAAGPVTVRVPERGGSADDLIRAIVDGAADPATLVVVTSDKPLYSYARTRGAAILRAHEWNRRQGD